MESNNNIMYITKKSFFNKKNKIGARVPVFKKFLYWICSNSSNPCPMSNPCSSPMLQSLPEYLYSPKKIARFLINNLTPQNLKIQFARGRAHSTVCCGCNFVPPNRTFRIKQYYAEE